VYTDKIGPQALEQYPTVPHETLSMNLVSAESERTCIALTEPDIRARAPSNLSTWLAVVPMSVAPEP